MYQRHNLNSYYNREFIWTLFVFTIMTTLMTMVIGNNIARAFGLVGALSLVRFRSVMKSTLDTAFVFWSLGTGMACGTGQFIPAICITIFMSLVLIILEKTNFGRMPYTRGILRMNLEALSSQETLSKLSDVLQSKK